MMRRRINITIDDDISDSEALAYVFTVVDQGRISGYPVEDTYCYGTRFVDGTVVSAWKTKAGNDGFMVYRETRG